MKFGGGCLGNAEDFLKVMRITRDEEKPQAIVVSAIYGVTNELLEKFQLVIKSEKYIVTLIEKLHQKHRMIVKNAITNERIKDDTLQKLKTKVSKLERLMFDVSLTEVITDSIKAEISSFGERLAAIILAGVMMDNDINAKALDADEIGIITDNSFENATAILPTIKENFKKTLVPIIEQGIIPIITGFFGCTIKGKITTFGRNGSDYSAAVVAKGLAAEKMILWKKTNGFMSADPKVVVEARKIEQLSFYEVAELAYFGAKILHPRALEPLHSTSIRIIIRNFNDPIDVGTLILPQHKPNEAIIKSITYNKDIAVLRILGPGVGYKPGIIGEIGNALAKIGVNIYSIITSQTCINLLIHPNDAQKSYKIITKIAGDVIQNIILEEDIGLIAVIGEGLMQMRGLAAKVFTTVAEEGINIEMISAGASEVAYYFIIKRIYTEKAINAIHRVLIKTN